jgi:Fibronectin type III domain
VQVAIPPPTVPGSPAGVGGTARYHSVVLNWTAPSNVGGSPITSYRITPYADGGGPDQHRHY